MANFTLFEVHLPEGNVQFGPSGLDFVRTGKSDADHVDADEGTEIDVDEDDESGGPGLGSLLVALVVLGVVAFAASKFLGGSDEGFEELEELDDLADEA